jgi:hypothetical protein
VVEVGEDGGGFAFEGEWKGALSGDAASSKQQQAAASGTPHQNTKFSLPGKKWKINRTDNRFQKRRHLILKIASASVHIA